MPSGSTSATSPLRTASPPEPPHSIVRTIADSLIAVLIAPRCAACDTPLDRPTRGAVCGRCWNAIVPLTPPLCRQCGDPLPSWRVISLDASTCPRCRRSGSAVSSARAIGAYDGTLRVILHALKYGKRPSVAVPLARLMIASAGDLVSGVESRRPRAVAPAAAARTRLQSGGRTGEAPGSRMEERAAPDAGNIIADRSAGREAARERPECLLAEERSRGRWADSAARGRCVHHRRHAERVRRRAATGRGPGRPRPHRGASRVETAVSTSARTASRERSPSRRSQLVEAAA